MKCRQALVRLMGAILPLLTCVSESRAQQVTGSAVMTLNVNEMPVAEVLKLIADNGGMNLAIGNGVSGQVTLYVKDYGVAKLLDLVVDMTGAAYSLEKGVIRVMTQEAYEDLYGRPFRDHVKPQVINVQNVAVQDILPGISVLHGKAGQLVADNPHNRLIVLDTPYHVDQMKTVLSEIDQPLETRSFNVAGSPDQMAVRLRTYLPAAARVEADGPARRLLVTADHATLARAASILELLSRGEDRQTRAFTMAYAGPDTVRKAIQSFLSDGAGDVWVDARTRQLFVTDFPEHLEAIAARVAELDVPARQVLIEARIVQVSISDEVKTGIDWEVLQRTLNGTGVRANFPILTNTEGGLHVSATSPGDFRVVFEALEVFGKAELLSSPRIMVADGLSARIHVGSQVPYVTVDSREGPNGVIDRFEKVTIVSVGVLLDVKARIHSGDMVSLEIRPEVSSVTGFASQIPIVETSESSSTVLIRDRNTVILGGLNRDEVREDRKGIPLLSRIPILKYATSSIVKKKVRTELAILLTPRILTGMENMAAPDSAGLEEGKP